MISFFILDVQGIQIFHLNVILQKMQPTHVVSNQYVISLLVWVRLLVRTLQHHLQDSQLLHLTQILLQTQRHIQHLVCQLVSKHYINMYIFIKFSQHRGFVNLLPHVLTSDQCMQMLIKFMRESRLLLT